MGLAGIPGLQFSLGAANGDGGGDGGAPAAPDAPAGVPWAPGLTQSDVAQYTGATPQPPPIAAGGGGSPADDYANSVGGGFAGGGGETGPTPQTPLGQVAGAAGFLQPEPFDFSARFQQYMSDVQKAYEPYMRQHLPESTRPGLAASILSFGMANAYHRDYETAYNAAVDQRNAEIREHAVDTARAMTEADADYHSKGLAVRLNALNFQYRMGIEQQKLGMEIMKTYGGFMTPQPDRAREESLANMGQKWLPIWGGKGTIFDMRTGQPVAPIPTPPGGWGGFFGGPGMGGGGGGMGGGGGGAPGVGGGGGAAGPAGAAPVHRRPIVSGSPLDRAAGGTTPTPDTPTPPSPAANAPSPAGAAPSDLTRSYSTTTQPGSPAGPGATTTTPGVPSTTLYTTQERQRQEAVGAEAKAAGTAKGKAVAQFDTSANRIRNLLNGQDFNDVVSTLLPANHGLNPVQAGLQVAKARAAFKLKDWTGSGTDKEIDAIQQAKQFTQGILPAIGAAGSLGAGGGGLRIGPNIIDLFEGGWKEFASGSMSREKALAWKKAVLAKLDEESAAVHGTTWQPPGAGGAPAGGGGGAGGGLSGGSGVIRPGVPWRIIR